MLSPFTVAKVGAQLAGMVMAVFAAASAASAR